jgi:hypothetical protein
MGIMNCCAKCGAVVCACGFAATLMVSVLGGSKPPPPRVVGPIVAQLSSTISTTIPTVSFLDVSDQITGKWCSAVLVDKQKQRELAYSIAYPAGAVGDVSPWLYYTLAAKVA